MVKITIHIEENGNAIHQIIAEVSTQAGINAEECIRELHGLITGWAESWLRYPHSRISIETKEP